MIFLQNKKNLAGPTSPAVRPHAGSHFSKSFILSDKIIHEPNHNRNPQTNHAYNPYQIIHIISISIPESLKKKKENKEEPRSPAPPPLAAAQCRNLSSPRPRTMATGHCSPDPAPPCRSSATAAAPPRPRAAAAGRCSAAASHRRRPALLRPALLHRGPAPPRASGRCSAAASRRRGRALLATSQRAQLAVAGRGADPSRPRWAWTRRQPRAPAGPSLCPPPGPGRALAAARRPRPHRGGS